MVRLERVYRKGDTGDTIDSAATTALPIVTAANPIAGAALGVGVGIYDLISASNKRKKAEGAMPPLEDPEMRSYLSDLDRKRKSMATGSYYANQLNELQNQQANTDQGVISTAGGSGGAAIEALERTQRNTGQAYGNLITKNEGAVNQTNQMYGSLLNTIAQRKADLQLMRYNQLMGDAAEQQKAGTQNLMAGIARGIPMGGGDKTIADPQAGMNITTGNVMLPDRNTYLQSQVPYDGGGSDLLPQRTDLG